MTTFLKYVIALAATISPAISLGQPPINYTVYKELGSVMVYSNCVVRGDLCNIVDPAKAEEKRNKMRNFNDQIRWLGRESERAAYENDPEAVENVKKWFLDYESTPGLLHEHPTEGKSDRDIEEIYQELHYVMFNIAMSYYKTKHFFTAEEQKRINTWFENVIKLNMYSSTSKYGFRTISHNNHYYIIASSLSMTGVVIGNKQFISDAKRIIDESIEEMNYDGGWPLELKRGDKSGHYQMFMLNHMIIATLAVGLDDLKWAEKRISKFKKTELFTARLISDDQFFASKTNAQKIDMSMDYSAGKRCTGQVWSWIALSKNKSEINSIMQNKYIDAYDNCSNDYLVGGNPSTLRDRVFK